MDGIKRPVRRPVDVAKSLPPTPASPSALSADIASPPDLSTINLENPEPEVKKIKSRRKWPIIALFIAVVLVAAALAIVGWYSQQSAAINPSDSGERSVEVKKGDSISAISLKLKSLNLIRNQYVFELNAKLRGSNIKAGTCKLTPSMSVGQILDKLEQGCHEFKIVTFYPGATIEKPLYTPQGTEPNLGMYIKYRLSDSGYTDEQISEALTHNYTGPLFNNKPAGTTLEGYVFGETYYLKPDATAQDALQASFDQMYKVVQQDDLVAKFKAQGLNLYQGITLASIVQRELNCEGKPTEERKQRCYTYEQSIAQVFLERLKQGMTLGSDVTFIYAADMMGVEPRVDLDSPYNTRVHVGLPPGPVASPGELALMAVANPSKTNYLYFVAGDDGLIYFAKTYDEHLSNVAKYCQKLCSEL